MSMIVILVISKKKKGKKYDNELMRDQGYANRENLRNADVVYGCMFLLQRKNLKFTESVGYNYYVTIKISLLYLQAILQYGWETILILKRKTRPNLI